VFKNTATDGAGWRSISWLAVPAGVLVCTDLIRHHWRSAHQTATWYSIGGAAALLPLIGNV